MPRIRDFKQFELNKIRPFDLKSFFYDEDIEFLIRSNGDQVHVSDLDGKIVGLYFFSAAPRQWRSHQFSTKLVEIYNELASMGEDFEVVAIGGCYQLKEQLDECFSKMPWLAIPFLESEAIQYLCDQFEVGPYPRLIILDANGMIVTEEGSYLLAVYGIEAYPFTTHKLKQLMEKEQQQPLIQRILGTTSCDFLIGSDGSKVPVSELEGKIIGLFYSCCKLRRRWEISILGEVYRKLREGGKNFEIVLVCLDDNETSFDRCFKGMPWLAIPFAFMGNICRRLYWKADIYDQAKRTGVLHMIDTDGGTLNYNAILHCLMFDIEKFPFCYTTIQSYGMKIASLECLLVREERDYVIRNDGTMVKLSNLEWKVVAFYWSASHIPQSGTHTQKLVNAYHEFRSKCPDFEIVYVSHDKDEESFNEYFSKMPWLAIPYFDVAMRVKLQHLITGKQIPHLMIRDRSGNVLPEEAFWALTYNDSNVCPFTTELWNQFIEEEQVADKEQSAQSLLGTHGCNFLEAHGCDFLVSNKGDKVPTSELQGKIIGLYFLGPCLSSRGLSEMLKEVYGNLKKRGEKFEIVLAFLDNNISSFDSIFATMPWLAIPVNDKSCRKISRYFTVSSTPTLTVVGSDGMTLNPNAKDLVEEYGDEAYPFSPEKIEELAEKYKPNTKPETLLVSWQRDYLLGKGGSKVPVSKLAGKTILLYFGRTEADDVYRPKLREVYFKLKEREFAFEVILVWNCKSNDGDVEEKLFAESFSAMPWLALPCDDARIDILLRKLSRRGYTNPPSVVGISPSGRALTKGSRLEYLIRTFGADAYPFTKNQLRVLEKRFEELQKQIYEMAEKMPKRIKHPLHAEHQIVKRKSGTGIFFCIWCREFDHGWYFYCPERECGHRFALHIKCAVESMKMEDWAQDVVAGEDLERLFDEDACS